MKLHALFLESFQENVRLKEQNDDLQAQVLGMQVREGRNLLATGSTLADELQTLPRDEVGSRLLLLKFLVIYGICCNTFA